MHNYGLLFFIQKKRKFRSELFLNIFSMGKFYIRSLKIIVVTAFLLRVYIPSFFLQGRFYVFFYCIWWYSSLLFLSRNEMNYELLKHLEVLHCCFLSLLVEFHAMLYFIFWRDEYSRESALLLNSVFVCWWKIKCVNEK